jgi:hypothetical protein
MLQKAFGAIIFSAAALLGCGIAFLVSTVGDADALFVLVILSGLVAALAFLRAW